MNYITVLESLVLLRKGAKCCVSAMTMHPDVYNNLMMMMMMMILQFITASKQ